MSKNLQTISPISDLYYKHIMIVSDACTISIINNASRTVNDTFRSIIDDARVTHQTVVSLTWAIIYHYVYSTGHRCPTFRSNVVGTWKGSKFIGCCHRRNDIRQGGTQQIDNVSTDSKRNTKNVKISATENKLPHYTLRVTFFGVSFCWVVFC